MNRNIEKKLPHQYCWSIGNITRYLSIPGEKCMCAYSSIFFVFFDFFCLSSSMSGGYDLIVFFRAQKKSKNTARKKKKPQMPKLRFLSVFQRIHKKCGFGRLRQRAARAFSHFFYIFCAHGPLRARESVLSRTLIPFQPGSGRRALNPFFRVYFLIVDENKNRQKNFFENENS